MSVCICGKEIGSDTDEVWVHFSVTPHNSDARQFAVSLCGECAIRPHSILKDAAIDTAGQKNSTWPADYHD